MANCLKYISCGQIFFHLHSSHTNIKPYNYCKVKLSFYKNLNDSLKQSFILYGIV